MTEGFHADMFESYDQNDKRIIHTYIIHNTKRNYYYDPFKKALFEILKNTKHLDYLVT